MYLGKSTHGQVVQVAVPLVLQQAGGPSGRVVTRKIPAVLRSSKLYPGGIPSQGANTNRVKLAKKIHMTTARRVRNVPRGTHLGAVAAGNGGARYPSFLATGGIAKVCPQIMIDVAACTQSGGTIVTGPPPCQTQSCSPGTALPTSTAPVVTTTPTSSAPAFNLLDVTTWPWYLQAGGAFALLYLLLSAGKK
jgi:hypothetical protein